MHSVTHPPSHPQPSRAQRDRRLAQDCARRAHEALLAAAACVEAPNAGACQRTATALKTTGLANTANRHAVGESGFAFGLALRALGLRFEALARLLEAAELDDDSDPSDPVGNTRELLVDALGLSIEGTLFRGSEWRAELRLDQPVDWEACHAA